MKRKLTALSRQYVTALQKHLKQEPAAGAQPALKLGRAALALGLETLDVAKIHDRALAKITPSGGKVPGHRTADQFFAEAITPIEETHRAARAANQRLGELNQALGRRTVDLAAANRSLKEGIRQRKAVQAALKKRGLHSEALLNESRRLQKHLQHLTHRILLAQENKRKKFSHELQHEIAQTLVGINVRLLTLKREAVHNAEGLQKEIASTHRLVDKSVASIKRFAREHGQDHRK